MSPACAASFAIPAPTIPPPMTSRSNCRAASGSTVLSQRIRPRSAASRVGDLDPGERGAEGLLSRACVIRPASSVASRVLRTGTRAGRRSPRRPCAPPHERDGSRRAAMTSISSPATSTPCNPVPNSVERAAANARAPPPCAISPGRGPTSRRCRVEARMVGVVGGEGEEVPAASQRSSQCTDEATRPTSSSQPAFHTSIPTDLRRPVERAGNGARPVGVREDRATPPCSREPSSAAALESAVLGPRATGSASARSDRRAHAHRVRGPGRLAFSSRRGSTSSPRSTAFGPLPVVGDR